MRQSPLDQGLNYGLPRDQVLFESRQTQEAKHYGIHSLVEGGSIQQLAFTQVQPCHSRTGREKTRLERPPFLSRVLEGEQDHLMDGYTRAARDPAEAC